MDLNGYYILKEQVSDDSRDRKGEHKYTLYSKETYHRLFKEAYFEFEIIYQREWCDND